MAQIMRCVCDRGEHPDIPHGVLPPSVEATLLRCFAQEPHDRPTAYELWQCLQQSDQCDALPHAGAGIPCAQVDPPAKELLAKRRGACRIKAAMAGTQARRVVAEQQDALHTISSQRLYATMLGAVGRRLTSANKQLPSELEVEVCARRLPVDVRAEVWNGARLLRDTATGRYRPSTWSAVLAISAALAYLVNPLDVIPDAVPFIGLSDDLALLLAVFGGVAAMELARYRMWAVGHQQLQLRA